MTITLHFQPDWPHGDGLVIEAMARDGSYHSQFVAGVSNGLLAPVMGSDRWRWESRLFRGRYDEGRATYCCPDSTFDPDDFGEPEVLPRLCAIADATSVTRATGPPRTRCPLTIAGLTRSRWRGPWACADTRDAGRDAARRPSRSAAGQADVAPAGTFRTTVAVSG